MWKIGMVLLVINLSAFNKVKGQAAEIAQLGLNIEKLAQLKSILTSLKKGYEIVSKGYGAVKSISEGNFNLHQTFLDGLMAVSPAVKRYRKIPEIIQFQAALMKGYKSAYGQIRSSGWLNEREIRYVGNVYDNLISGSLKNLDELTLIITANKLRMSDDERLGAIDRIHSDMLEKVTFLRRFNGSNLALAMQRAKESKELNGIRSLYDIKQ